MFFNWKIWNNVVNRMAEYCSKHFVFNRNLKGQFVEPLHIFPCISASYYIFISNYKYFNDHTQKQAHIDLNSAPRCPSDPQMGLRLKWKERLEEGRWVASCTVPQPHTAPVHMWRDANFMSSLGLRVCSTCPSSAQSQVCLTFATLSPQGPLTSD